LAEFEVEGRARFAYLISGFKWQTRSMASLRAQLKLIALMVAPAIGHSVPQILIAFTGAPVAPRQGPATMASTILLA
jgi:hypothetical protein